MKKYFLDKKKETIALLIITFSIIVTYQGLLNNFFEQDEWAVFADMIVFSGFSLDEKIRFLFRSSGILSHFIPFTTLISYALFHKVFRFTYEYYAVFSIFLHVVNASLLFLIARKLSKNTLIAFFAAMLFGIHKLSSQVIIWIAASIGAELSTLFFLLSMLTYLLYLEQKKQIYFISSISLFIFSFLFKETSLTLIVAYPFLRFWYTKAKNIQAFLGTKETYTLLFFPISVVFVFIFKLILLFVNPHHAPIVVGNSTQFPGIIMVKMIFYPLLALAHVFDPVGYLFTIATVFMKAEYPYLAQSAIGLRSAETIVPDVLYLLFSVFVCVLLLVTIVASKREEDKRIHMLFLFTIALFFISLLPYIPLPRFTTFLEQRYYYTPHIFSAILISTLFYYWCRRLLGKIGIGLYIVLMVSIIMLNYLAINAYLGEKLVVAEKRKAVLSQLKEKQPRLVGNKNVFYITGSGSDYLIEDLKVPFQSGFGNVLMVWYYDEKHSPSEMVDQGYLYQLDDQGYKEIGSSGFGYYFKIEDMKKDLRQGKFSLDHLSAYSWDDKKQQLGDITQETKDALRRELHEENQ